MNMKTNPGSIRCVLGAILMLGADGIIETSTDGMWLAVTYIILGTIMLFSGIKTIQKESVR